MVWDATSTGNLKSVNDLSGLSLNQINYLAAPAGVVVSGNAMTITAQQPFVNATGGSITINNDLALRAAGVQLNQSNAIVLNGVLSGPATMTIQFGSYAFFGENTFSAASVIIGSGNAVLTTLVNTLKNSGVNQSLGTGSRIEFGRANGSDRGNLYYTGETTSTNKEFMIQMGGGVFNNGSGPLTWSGAQVAGFRLVNPSFTLGGFNTDANRWSSAIGDNPSFGTVGLIKAGRGSWTLSGENSFTGGLSVNSGTLVLDYDYADIPPVVATTLAPVLGGGTLEFKGMAGAGNSTAQTLGNATATDATGLSTIRINQNGGDGVALTLGTVSVNPTANFGPSSVLFDLNGSSGSTVTIGTAINPTAGASTVNGRILIRTAAGQYDFAQNNNNTATALAAVNSVTSIGATTGSATTDYGFSDTAIIGTGETTTAISTRSLRIAPTQNGQVMTILNASATFSNATGLRVAGNGLLFDGGGFDFEIKASNGQFAPIADNDSGSNETSIYHMGTGKLTIADNIYLGRTTTDGFFFIGAQGGLVDFKGRVVATNASTNAAAFGVNGDIVARISGTTDTIRFDNATSGVGSSTIRLGGGGVFELGKAEALTRNLTTTQAAGAIRWTGDGGFSAFGGDRTVNFSGGVSSLVTWGSGGFVPDDNALMLSSQYSDSTIEFQNPLALGRLQRVVQVANGSAAVDARLSGVLSSGLTGGLVKEGAGTLELTAANTYAGETWVRAGSLLVNGDQSAANGAVRVFAGAMLRGTGSLGSASAVISGTVAPGLAGAIGTLTFAGSAMNFSSGGSLLAELNSDPAVFTSDLLANSGVGSGLTLDGTSILDLTGPASFTTAGIYTLATFASGSLSGQFTTVRYNGTPYVNPTTTNAVNSNGTLVYNAYSIQFVVVPEPSTLVLLGGGMAIGGGWWRRARRSLGPAQG